MICGKDLLIEYIGEDNEQRPRIKIELAESDAPEFNMSEQVGRDSIDLRIGKTGYKIKCNFNYINTLDENISEYFYDFEIPLEGYIIYPGETIIVNTVEKIKLTGNITGEIMGRTRFARMGLSVCMATKFQSYSDSVAVLQLTNNNHVPLKIFPYQKLVQMIVHEVSGMPNSVRGSYSNESKLKKPVIDNNEFKGMSNEEKGIIKKQQPILIPHKSIDGRNELLSKNERTRISKNNRSMYICSKFFSCLSAVCGVLISIFCSFKNINAVLIIILAILCVFCTIISVVLDIYKEKNYID